VEGRGGIYTEIMGCQERWSGRGLSNAGGVSRSGFEVCVWVLNDPSNRR